MSSGGSNDPRQGQDQRYDWLYGGQSDPNDPGSANDPTRVIPSSGRAGREHPAAQGYPPPGPGGYPPHGQQYGQQYGQPGYPPPRSPQYPQQGYPPGYPPPHGPRPAPGQGQGPPHGPGARPGGYGGRPPHRPRPIRRGRTFLRTVGILVLAYLVFLIAMPLIGWSRVDRVAFKPSGDRPADAPGTTYLLVGSDSREGLTDKERRELGTGSAGGQRTDTIMLLQVPDVGPPVLVSIPRDSYVSIPDHGENRVNAAFSFGGTRGGAKLLATTLEQETGVRIDEYVEIGFGGFVGMVNAVDGVKMCLKEPIQDDYAHIDLPKGCQNLKGKNALGYVRARHFDPRGDFGRVERQQKFLGALADEAMSPATIFNPIKYSRLSIAGGESLTLGKSTGLIDTARFALAMRTVAGGGGVSLTVPSGTATISGMSVVVWDEEDSEALFEALRQGERIPADLLPDKDEEN